MTEQKTFKELGLSENALFAINKKGFEEPTPIQAVTIPLMLRDDSNIIAQAQTGTGRTAAFGLPLIELINEKSNAVQALILAPTRELAIQVAEEINSLKGKKAIKVVPIYGGQSIDQQLRRLKRGVQIVVGTPGRIIDHLGRKTLKLGEIEHLILDEADEMLNMGFIEDMEKKAIGLLLYYTGCLVFPTTGLLMENVLPAKVLKFLLSINVTMVTRLTAMFLITSPFLTICSILLMSMKLTIQLLRDIPWVER